MYKYEQIARDIEEKISSGYYKPDEKLPQEKQLCQMYDTSRITVREAMDVLVNRGFIIKKRGAGTFVKAIPGGRSSGFSSTGQFGGFTSDHPGAAITSDIKEFSLVKADANVAEKLQLPEGTFVARIIRVRSIDGHPQVVEYTYMPNEYLAGTSEDILKGSIYAHLENDLHLKINSANRIARAVMPDEREKEWLDIEQENLPLLEIEQVAYLDNGQIFEYSKSRHRSDCFELQSVSFH